MGDNNSGKVNVGGFATLKLVGDNNGGRVNIGGFSTLPFSGKAGVALGDVRAFLVGGEPGGAASG